MARKQRDPLAPIQFIVAFSLALGALVFTLQGLDLAFGETRHVQSACVRIHDLSLMSPSLDAGNGTNHITDDVSLQADEFRVCTSNASSSEVFWEPVSGAEPAAFGYGALLLLGWITRVARRKGLFTPQVARAITGLGVYALLGRSILALGAALIRRHLLDLILGTSSWSAVSVHANFMLLLTGLGLISLGRVMRHATHLQDEVDATV